ncbi:hypothetical protein B0H67DRAFT_551525 [Lasiosphaeris hirsuta]|uniref:NmrA-like domain-containing protein n=1 Tax=Lasiosphaeris hirsuta TaxID=260670 RepID=A0AA40E312_9PEZI|nr:hypothetical protein B0H67DRAFT_551525 [Lasiosphaeris hirsuta]
MSRTVLICGATGKQGGSVIRRLLAEKADFEILAVTRDASSASARKLSETSPKIKLVQGNLAKPDALFETAQKVASSPIWGVFSVQVPMGSDQGGVSELAQGKALVDSSITAGVKFFVYTSVDRGGESSPNNPTDVPHFISKHGIEQHLIESTRKAEGKMEWAILRPVAFMENFTDNFFGRVFVTTWKLVIKNKPLQLIATSDIGFFGAQAFLHPEQYNGRAISLAGDELTFDQLAAVVKRQTGRELQFTYKFVCLLIMWMMKDLGLMYKWFHEVGYGADIAELKKMHPNLMDFSDWLRTESQFSRLVQS